MCYNVHCFIGIDERSTSGRSSAFKLCRYYRFINDETEIGAKAMEEAAIEALLFVAGDEGLTLEEIASLLDISTQSAFAQLMSLQQMYASSKRGLMLLEAGEKYELATKKDF